MTTAEVNYNNQKHNKFINTEILITEKKDLIQNDLSVFDNVDVRQIIHDIADCKYQDEPFFVCDLGNVVEKYRIWMEKMPRIKPYYAVKCNDSEVILQLLASLGTSFDCASKGEIAKVLNLGVSADRIIFANPTKPASHIQYALKHNIPTMTFDSDFELLKIKHFYPDAKLVLRIKCEAKDAQCPLGNKFGCDPIHDAPGLIELAHQEGMEIVGISFHVGSGCNEPPVFRRAIKAARDLFDYGRNFGFEMNLLDIGGGYPGDFGAYELLEQISTVVNNALDDLFFDLNVKVIAEPGRYFVASAYTLACNIHSKKIVSSPEDGTKKVMYYVTDGVYGSFNCKLFDHKHIVATLLNKPKNSSKKLSSIWGPTCDALDLICDDVFLPELDVGDWFVFENMGAYTIPIASPFNGFSLPQVKYYISHEMLAKSQNNSITSINTNVINDDAEITIDK